MLMFFKNFKIGLHEYTTEYLCFPFTAGDVNFVLSPRAFENRPDCCFSPDPESHLGLLCQRA
jgi:hypothetical protein